MNRAEQIRRWHYNLTVSFAVYRTLLARCEVKAITVHVLTLEAP